MRRACLHGIQAPALLVAAHGIYVLVEGRVAAARRLRRLPLLGIGRRGGRRGIGLVAKHAHRGPILHAKHPLACRQRETGRGLVRVCVRQGAPSQGAC